MAKDGKGKRRKREAPDAPLAVVPEGAPTVPVWQRAVTRVTGARACYGKPVEAHGHVVIPVATLRTFGGLGFGNGTPPAPDADATSSGGGGGGFVDARPIGFIDIGPDGARWQSIDAPTPARRASTTALAALGVVAATQLIVRAAVRRRQAAIRPWPVRSLRR
jgi:uncharacterized spore protein YtfJ